MATKKTFIGNIKGPKGEDGKIGADGVSATHSWNGTVLTIHSASGTSSADLKGEKGDRGEDGIQGKDGVSGVYVGGGDFPEGYNIKIDPNGEADDVVTRTEFDAAISEQNKKFGKTDYSNDEQIVGTWIDGKTIYRRSYLLSSPETLTMPNYSRILFVKGSALCDGCTICLGYFESTDSRFQVYFIGDKLYFNITATNKQLSEICLVIDYLKD